MIKSLLCDSTAFSDDDEKVSEIWISCSVLSVSEDGSCFSALLLINQVWSAVRSSTGSWFLLQTDSLFLCSPSALKIKPSSVHSSRPVSGVYLSPKLNITEEIHPKVTVVQCATERWQWQQCSEPAALLFPSLNCFHSLYLIISSLCSSHWEFKCTAGWTAGS